MGLDFSPPITCGFVRRNAALGHTSAIRARPPTIFRRIVLPAIRPAITAGALLTFARALGEFGAIVIVSGNLTGRTLTGPVFIFQLTSQFHPEQAAAVSTLLFGLSLVLVLVTERLISVRRESR